MDIQEKIYENINELFFAIQENNLEQAKKNITFLNINCPETNNENYILFQNENPLKFLDYLYYNETYSYALKNLNIIDNDIKIKLKWNLLIWELQKNKDINETNNLILKFLNNSEELKLYIQIIGFNKVKLDFIKLLFYFQDFTHLEELKNKKE